MARSVSGSSTHQPHIALLAGLVWLLVAGQLLWLDWRNIAEFLGDTDDALRLVQVREFLAGRGWYELHEPRLQPPIGYDSHWSRLIDAGLAGLYIAFGSFADAALAEQLMRAVWPLLWIGPAIAGALAIAWRLGGYAAAVVLLLLMLFGLPAFMQFRAGRIDHHDVQIALASLTLAAAIWADRARWTAWAAGGLAGLALAIGFEGMPFIVVAGAVFAARYILDRKHGAELGRFGLASAASAAIAFVISIAPRHWAQTACDAIAVNSAAPAILGGVALSAAGYWVARESRAMRSSAVAAALVLAALAFVAIEPRCVAGPLAMVDPILRATWLAHVREAQSLLATLRVDVPVGVGIAIYPAVALCAAIALGCDARMRRDSGFVATAGACLLSVLMTIVAIRATAYTFWFGMPLVAAALARLLDWLRLATLPTRAMIVLPFTPVVMTYGAIAMVDGFGLRSPKVDTRRDDPCLEVRSYAAMAKLAPGLVVADVDYGPFILALTPHSALGAPYHRMSYGISTSNRIFASPVEESRDILRQVRPTYVMFCEDRGPRGLSEAEKTRSLWGQLAEGRIPAWLEPVPDSGPPQLFRFKAE